ncbi:crossover junction endodeoxyribonuclease RuvC [Candidatus Microgenomates bacterium]|nr:crossover junction endodeoxyribonuclease RuvC [Candidatus Microgenomates bacterium]
MLVLGIDPGTATTGFGVIELNHDGLKVIDWGLIETSKDTLAHKRLAKIYEELSELIDKVKPDVFVIEKVFFANNAKTAISVGQAIGVMLLSAAYADVQVVEYSPMTIKKVLAGNGRADKKLMQQSVRKYLGAKVRSAKRKKTHFDNAADGLAIALCHLMHLDSSIKLA